MERMEKAPLTIGNGIKGMKENQDKTGEVNSEKIIVIDETIREGMQHRGIVFSYKQRENILEFQEKLGVDVCQAGYPSAHITEENNIRKLCLYAERKGFKIQVAGMGRAYIGDAEILIRTGLRHFHLHMNINNLSSKDLAKYLSNISESMEYLRNLERDANISLAMLDIGRTDPCTLETLCDFCFHKLAPDILSLPDTSGIMSPYAIYNSIRSLAAKAKLAKVKIGIHCHNDMGMANANTITGIKAGGRILEASALGIGERNGIADIFIAGKMLKEQGFTMNLRTEKAKVFQDYYEYVDGICRQQTGESILNYNTPFFGDAVKTHVAGTHGKDAFGIACEEKFFLNLLCGKHIVKKYLESAGIDYNRKKIDIITACIKSESANLQRRLTDREIQIIVENI